MNKYPTFLVIILAMFRVRSPSTTRSLAWNGAIWIALTCMTTILFGLSALHRLTQTTILKAALNFVLQLSLVRLCLFWPRFYYSLFRFKPHRRSIWDIITNPLPPIKAKAKIPSLKIVCLNENRCCFSFYQTRGAYAHLNQRIEKDLDEAVADATVAVFHDDPLRLAIPYVYILERLPEPPDGYIKSMLALTLILFVHLYPTLRGLTILWKKGITKIYTNQGQRRQQRHKTLPKMHIIAFAANANEGDSAYSWDTDGIPFIIDNSATAIISNE